MSYLVLARKWRPGDFDAIIGQEHVTRALRNAIRLDRVAHAFLFTGARGVGKTTAARVFAKALQCEQGPTETPCGTCSSCTEIPLGTCIDVFEIDGASNRGINEIRELRDGVGYAPQRDRYKIYIIDEVHMLTPEAFNALLKTLEEPPKHVKFVFATTEPQKIPVTILSRCQRYDFKRVPLLTIKAHLDDLLAREGVHLPEEGVRMVARESEGSVRDALSLLDRVISFAGPDADAKAVADCLGIADRRWLYSLLQGLLSDGGVAAALDVVADVHHYGYDMRAFTADVLQALRDLIVVKVCGKDARALELSDAEAKAFGALGERHSLAALQRMFQILLKAADDVAQSRHPRLVLEMAVVRCGASVDMQTVPEVLSRLEALERRLSTGESAPAAPRPAAPPLRSVPSEPRPVAEPPRRPTSPTPAAAPPPVAAPPPTTPQRLRLAPESWPAFIAEARLTERLFAPMLEHAQVLAAGDGQLRLGVQSEFFRAQLAAGPAYERLIALTERLFGPGVKVAVELVAEVKGTIASELTARRTAENDARRERVIAHPATAAVVDALGGKVVEVRVEEDRDE